MNKFVLLGIICLYTSACQSGDQAAGRQEQRVSCPSQVASESIGESDYKEKLLGCVKGINKQAASEPQAETSQPKGEIYDPVKSYAHCTFFREEIRAAYNLQNGFGLRVPHIEQELGADHPNTRKARADYQAALNTLSQLIPPAMREGMPLIPDAADKFSKCSRSEFGLE